MKWLPLACTACVWTACLLASGGSVPTLYAQDASAEQPPTPTKSEKPAPQDAEKERPGKNTAETTAEAPAARLEEAEIARLIEQLDAGEFATREAATKALIAGGSTVIPAVEQGAERSELELSTRCFAVLKGIYEGNDVDARAEAALALKRLCSSRQASVARRAKALLDPPVAKPVPPVAGQPLPGIRLNLQRNFQMGGGGRQVQMSNVNGKVQIDVTEGKRKVSISHQDQRDIKVRISEPGPGGNEPKVTEMQAANLKELEEQHPEAFKLFQEFNGQGEGLVPGLDPARMFPPGFPPGFPPALLPNQPPAGRAPANPPPAKARPAGPPGVPPPGAARRLGNRAGKANAEEPAEARPALRDSSRRLADLEKRLETVVDQLRREAESDQPQGAELKRLANELGDVRAALSDLLGDEP